MLKLTQHIKDGFETGKITGLVLVDLSAAYDTVNHRRLLEKVCNMTRDYRLMCMIRTLLENRRFFLELGAKSSRWRSQRNGLPQGSVLARLLFNVYTNDQPIHPGTRSFVYADDLAVTTQSTDFAPIEETLTSALDGLSEYYTTNQLGANPTKLSYKAHIEKTKKKVGTRNNIILLALPKTCQWLTASPRAVPGIGRA